MRLAVFITAACAWLRALTAPLALFASGAGVLALTAAVGIYRLWLAAIIGAALVGVAIGWAGLIATSSSRSPNNTSDDGEGESL